MFHSVHFCDMSFPLRFIVVGEKEQANTTVNVRTRDNKVHGEHAVSDVITKFKRFTENKVLEAEDKFE